MFMYTRVIYTSVKLKGSCIASDICLCMYMFEYVQICVEEARGDTTDAIAQSCVCVCVCV